jgi:hypothetical protein
MASTTLTSIIELLKTKVAALKNGTAPIFTEVLKSASGNFSAGFPAARIYETGGDGAVADTHRNQRTFNFTIKLYQEQSQSGKTADEAATIMRAATDAVITAFDQDKDLNREVMIVRVVSFTTDFSVQKGTFNFATIRVDVVVLVHSY